jgi:DNA replication and repair protein RecF
VLIHQLNCSYFRNIETATIDTSKKVNVIFGENGSGKTSVLEAAYFLSRAKSFRTNKRNELISLGQKSFVVSGLVQSGEELERLGCSLDDKGNTIYRLDKVPIDKLSTVSNKLPIQLITPESFDIFWGSPKARRSFFDFGLFHVEQQFHQLWSEFNRISKQIGSLLRNTNNLNELIYWYELFLDRAGQIDLLRKRFVETHFSQAIDLLKNEIEGFDKHNLLADLRLVYKDKVMGESVALKEQINRDLKYKQIGFGPNRADYTLLRGDLELSKVLSRGQSKMLFYMLVVATISVIQKSSKKSVVLLIDDLPSEVDKDTRKLMLKLISDSDCQVFVTGIEKDRAKEFSDFTNSINVFHVEHGTIRKINMEQLCP